MELLLCYLLFINVIGIVLMCLDKVKAKTGCWRVSENTLILIALFGGSVGIYLGLKFFHHKTKHFKFNFIVPVILLVQLIIGIWLLIKN